ncbi:MAG: GGDEF domain-containing protein [Deinococcus sp.]|uniref:GGDEF domain-containing protein n=1 Tax=Deinococcus sp. TaxID=47478 RepID=UPI0026DD31D8|nr:GGDEF domain-containing protein [Deinococcus sp.]MDO4246080.1 GGDEF domain-containing protein [Deinococcus sp.]
MSAWPKDPKQTALALLSLLLAALHLAVVTGGGAGRSLLTVDVLYAACIASTTLLALSGWRQEKRSGNGGLGWYALGMGALLLAELWMLQYDLPGRSTPEISVADPLYFLFYLGIAATLLRFHGLRGWSAEAWGALLDSLVVVVLVGELAWIAFLADALASPDSWLQAALNLTYVGLDLLLLTLTLLTLRRRFSLPLSLFGVGVVGFVVADLLYLNLEVREQYVAGTPLDALWTWGTVFQGIGIVWAWHTRAWELPQETTEQLATRRQDRMLRAVPYLAMVVSCVLLVKAPSWPWLQGKQAELWSVALFAVVMLRQAVSFWEGDELQTELLGRTHQLRYQALHDALTGLNNRTAFEDELAGALPPPVREPFVLLYLDLDGFKPINDQLGHAAGDEALRWVANRLRAALPPKSFIARLGGDEFTVLWRGSTAEAEALAERVRTALGQPMMLDAATAQIAASVGVVTVEAGTEHHPDHLWREADQAMYRVKRAARAAAQAESSAEADPKRAASET